MRGDALSLSFLAEEEEYRMVSVCVGGMYIGWTLRGYVRFIYSRKRERKRELIRSIILPAEQMRHQPHTRLYVSVCVCVWFE